MKMKLSSAAWHAIKRRVGTNAANIWRMTHRRGKIAVAAAWQAKMAASNGARATGVKRDISGKHQRQLSAPRTTWAQARRSGAHGAHENSGGKNGRQQTPRLAKTGRRGISGLRKAQSGTASRSGGMAP